MTRKFFDLFVRSLYFLMLTIIIIFVARYDEFTINWKMEYTAIIICSMIPGVSSGTSNLQDS